MDNISVIASLVLFGLFLIASPSEGYVVGYIDFSDQSLQSSVLKRQDESIMNSKMPEPEQDGDVMYASPERQKIEPGSREINKPLFPNNEYGDSRHDISSNQVAAENQNGETSQNENDILYQSADHKAEGEIMKKGDIMLANAQPHKENDDNLPGPNTIVLVQMTSSKL